ncbi:alpha-1A adrenergic receptor-like [Gigantopelta aegis]|uniref:alpha-1A adrenergic receptor-like n=1 Tax=Gigantopelta aegis TaxID=1735272 RepID=UPI001B888ED4|nr:alpha-1A adrenergic receptor-like [Gigantopelta aegis]
MMTPNTLVLALLNVVVEASDENDITPLQPALNLSKTSNMASQETQHQEAYYLYFIGTVGMVLNLVVVITILVRRTLRKMTSAFLIHCCFLNFLKSVYCIPFGYNLTHSTDVGDCSFQGSSYIIIITASSFNLMAMICTEAYTFGETNIGGNSRGSVCCVLFGILTVYVTSTIVHLGPTLIGGYFEFNSDIGSCAFILGEAMGYIANIMWIMIITLTFIGASHFLCKFYKEIQMNQPNRVSMLVRTSITIMDDPHRKQSTSSIRALIEDSKHRAKIFVMTVIEFIICWYPLFLLLIIDVNFKVSPKVYQAFSFIAWSQGSIEPMLYILFDRNLDLLASSVYCDRYKKYNRDTIAYLMSRHRQPASSTSAMTMDPGMDYVPCRHCHHGDESYVGNPTLSASQQGHQSSLSPVAMSMGNDNQDEILDEKGLPLEVQC